jgi:hypothetical protein
MGWAPLRLPDRGGQNSGAEFWREFFEKIRVARWWGREAAANQNEIC